MTRQIDTFFTKFSGSSHQQHYLVNLTVGEHSKKVQDT